MTDGTSVTIVPLNVGGRGKEGVRAFYRDVLIPTIPEDMQTTPLSRVIGDGYVVDELRFTSGWTGSCPTYRPPTGAWT